MSGAEPLRPGAWRPLDAILLEGPAASDPAAPENPGFDLGARDAAGFMGVTVRWSTILATATRFEAALEGIDEQGAALRIDLGAVDEGGSVRHLRDALEYEPDLILVGMPPSPLRGEAGDALDSELLAGEAGLVIEITESTSEALIEWVVPWACASESCIGLRVEPFAEPLAERVLDRFSRLFEGDLNVFAGTWEFASAFRRGIAWFDGPLGLMTAGQARALMELVETDLRAALALERRLQRFVEGTFERMSRGLSSAERDALLLDAFALSEDQGGRSERPRALDFPGELLAELEALDLPAPD